MDPQQVWGEQPQREIPHRERLVDFYRIHNPSMLSQVDAILNKYAGHEEILFQKLSRKYATQSSPTDSSHSHSRQNTARSGRSAREIAGYRRAEEIANHQNISRRNQEAALMGQLLKNQIELESRISRKYNK